MRVVVLHEKIPDDANLDAMDTLIQVESVSGILTGLGHDVVNVEFSTNFRKLKKNLFAQKPDVVFNLVESVEDRTELAYLPPMFLDKTGIPYTGCSSKAILSTSNKILVKKKLKTAGIPTPPWINGKTINKREISFPDLTGPFIIKMANEHASIGMGDDSVVPNLESALKRIAQNDGNEDSNLFIEKYVGGREFNISLLADGESPIVLAPQEICFVEYPRDKARIITYEGKWDTNSFEYKHTRRRFDFPPEDIPMLENIKNISRQCWKVLKLSGYARIDLRIDDNNGAWVIDINTNPCISPDSSFLYAAMKAGLDLNRVISNILYNPVSGKKPVPV